MHGFGQEMRRLWLLLCRVLLFFKLLVVAFLTSVFGIKFVIRCICCHVIVWTVVLLLHRHQHAILIAVEWMGA